MLQQLRDIKVVILTKKWFNVFLFIHFLSD